VPGVTTRAAGSPLVDVLVLGGDGFCGWPTALHLSACGHRVTIVDNFARRRADEELGIASLTPIRTLDERVAAWRETTGREIAAVELDVARDYDALLALLGDLRPDAVVHFAEQRAAPYSMKSSWHKRYTVDNNVNATHNLLAALVDADLDAHVVHLGTMGVYGYGTDGARIPEGYLTVSVRGDDGGDVEREILHPTDPGSVYHATKTLDQLLFAFYAKNDRLRITDLHQGIVWGTQTDETSVDERLINRFDYDGDYGTVLNRFLMQAAIGHPLTVHGTGRQSRAFIHIRDTVRCIELAIANPPRSGDRVQIFNQATEVHRVLDLAHMVSRLTAGEVMLVDNPRNEAPDNELAVENTGLQRLGLRPTMLADELLGEVTHVAARYVDRVDRSKIPCTSRWTRRQVPAVARVDGRVNGDGAPAPDDVQSLKRRFERGGIRSAP
jgi:UDP-sulfoquinovose synthase